MKPKKRSSTPKPAIGKRTMGERLDEIVTIVVATVLAAGILTVVFHL